MSAVYVNSRQAWAGSCVNLHYIAVSQDDVAHGPGATLDLQITILRFCKLFHKLFEL